MVVQRWIKKLLPKDPRFAEVLLEQATLVTQVARELSSTAHVHSVSAIAPSIAALEEQAAAARHRMMALLAATAVTPLDRTDLHALSSALHRAIDALAHAGRALSDYGLSEPTAAMAAQLELLLNATGRLQVAVGGLRSDDLWSCRQARQEIVSLEKQADELHQDELRRLFRSPQCDASTLLRERAVLDSLEDAIDGCLHAADVLERIAIKQG